ncbi:hypothetical protein C1638_015905 [Chryseobacterium oncorhynchi]|uniref:Uncharacterized protein n=2 Tax=Chryseobacterium oncorhynchi TaxID=741074 RepID=A0A316WRY3_9FLAO|nr:hypothetical protein C1638_015905 [Chryseobacterium oncorhynchi]
MRSALVKTQVTKKNSTTMRLLKSFFIEFLILFLFVNIVIVLFLFIDIPEVQFNLKSVSNIILRFGIIFSIPVSLVITGSHFLYSKIAKNTFLKILIIIIALVLLYILYYIFYWYVGISGLIDDPFAQ